MHLCQGSIPRAPLQLPLLLSPIVLPLWDHPRGSLISFLGVRDQLTPQTPGELPSLLCHLPVPLPTSGLA